MIKNLSPSRASQFKTCPKQFKFANVDKLKEPTNEVQAKGTTVHQALEDLFDLPKEEREWGVDGLKLLNNYMEIEDPTSFEPLERERWVRGSINDLNLRGILDRMDRNQNGDLIIVDYKSGKAPMAKYKEPRFFALKLYALLIKEELGEMPVELKLIYLKNSTIHTLKITEEDLSNAKNEILEIWENIKKAYEENEFPAIKNTLCDWCYYKPICPVFNENAPNTENLRIINESIAELVEEIEVLDMFKDDDKIPVDSPIGNTNRTDIESKISELENQKNEIQTEIEKLLREQSSS